MLPNPARHHKQPRETLDQARILRRPVVAIVPSVDTFDRAGEFGPLPAPMMSQLSYAGTLQFDALALIFVS